MKPHAASSIRLRRTLAVVVAAAGLSLPAVAVAQRAAPESVTVVPGGRYAKGGVYRFFFGTRYRELWTAPIRVEVLDLARFAGGLKPLRKGGGQQTSSLRFSGADGRQYQFRSVDKDPTAALPPDLRNTFADQIFQDQISAGHPTGALAVPPILVAAGVLHAQPKLVMMPDDPALGEFRAEFGKVLGTIEERPRNANEDDVSFAGAIRIVDTEEMIEALENEPAIRVDSRTFLRARLTDVFLGDWDRHQDQWRWALVTRDQQRLWLPIPRDRDQAFSRFDGFLLKLVRRQVPQLTNFGSDYPKIVGATWNGRDLDRRLLTDLEWVQWDSVARDLTNRLTDAVLVEAVSLLPVEHQRIDGPKLERALRQRRDDILKMARRYYVHLAGEVDVHVSDVADVAAVTRVDNRYLEVTLTPAAGSSAPYYRRRFDERETNEVRVYLHGRNDRGVIRGDGSVGVKVRFIGGGGDDTFADSSGGGRRAFYDDRGTNTAIGGGIDRRSYRAIDDTADPTALPHRDWGQKRISFPMASFGPDAGLMIGWGGMFTRFGFRHKPWSSRFGYQALLATGANTGRLDLSYRSMNENSRSFWAVEALLSGIEVLRWHGFGNETTLDLDESVAFYRATQHQIVVSPSLGWALGERGFLTFGPRFKYAVTELDDGQNADRFIGIDRPFGTGHFSELGLGAELEVDTRDLPAAARRGFHVVVSGRFYPALFDIEDRFGVVSAEASTYLTARIPTTPTLGLYGGGTMISGAEGRVPFHDAAFLGSSKTLRGFRPNRFAGDEGAVWGSAELRLHFTNLFLVVPGRQGVFGFYDIGRVYDSRDLGGIWHWNYGGGVWLSFLTPGSLLSLSLAKSEEGNRFHARVGFAW